MSTTTSIEWCDRTWGPVRGCSRVSLGCGGPGRVGGCYAERQAHRFNYPGGPYEGLTRMTENGPRWTGVVRLVLEALDEPLRWRKPQKVFVNSMSDLFHESLPDEEIAAVFGIMAAAPRHTFQILTKRPRRMRDWFVGWLAGTVGCSREVFPRDSPAWIARHVVTNRARHFGAPSTVQASGDEWPLPNVWLGVSCEDQATADERIPLLLQTPAAVRFVSYEPAISGVDFESYLFPTCDGCGEPKVGFDGEWSCRRPGCSGEAWTKHGLRLDWLIVGGESGPGARPFRVSWARSARDQCRAAGVAFFMKQVGAYVVDRSGLLGTGNPTADPQVWPEPDSGWDDGPGGNLVRNLGGYPDDYQRAQVRIRLRDRKGGDPSEWPEDLRVREMPEVGT